MQVLRRNDDVAGNLGSRIGAVDMRVGDFHRDSLDSLKGLKASNEDATFGALSIRAGIHQCPGALMDMNAFGTSIPFASGAGNKEKKQMNSTSILESGAVERNRTSTG